MHSRFLTTFPSAACLGAVSALALLAAGSARAATIPGLFNTGVDNAGALLAPAAVDPHYRLVQSADAAFLGPNAFVVNETWPVAPNGGGPWLANGPVSKWIAPQAPQATGNAAGNYTYRLTFNLTGLEPSTALITGRWTSDNAGPGVLLNGVTTGFTSDGNFPALGNPFTISSGFIDGINTLDFVVNNADVTVNPTGFRAEVSGTADLQPPPGTPPSILVQPASASAGLLDPATFSVGATGSRPLSYQWRLAGTSVGGATNMSFAITSAHVADAGSYDVVVANAFGSVTSSVATLTIVFLSPAQLSYEPLGPSSRRSGLSFSEIMYHPAPNADGRRTEFVELYNSNPFFEDISGWRLSGDIDYIFPANTVIQGNSFLVVAPVPADVMAAYGITGVLGGFTNAIPNDSGTLRLRKRSGGVVLEVSYSDQPPWPVAADGTGHSLVLARPTYGENDPRAWAASASKGGSPGAADPVPTGVLENVLINEILAHTDPPLADYIELFNNSTLPADLSGCWLSDDPTTNKFRIPDGTVLAPRGFVSFVESTMGFSNDASGETLYLVNSNQTRVLDALRFDGQASGVAFGRYPDGGPTFNELAACTPGTTNAPLLLRPVVINEIMFAPLSGDADDQFVEIYNRGGTPANIGGWRFTAGIDFTFPPGWTIPAGGYCVVAKNASRLMTNYTGLNTANLLGNFSGKLSKGGERLALSMPDFVVTADGPFLATNRFYIVMDEVTYADGGRWGRWSDGGGSSLELIDAHSDNRQPSNWADSDETGKAGWTTVEFTGVLDLGSGTADRLQVLLLGPGEALVDDVEVLVSSVNRVTNPGFESGTAGWSSGGTHSKSGLENSGYNSAHSLHLRASDRGNNAADRVYTVLSSAVAPNATATIRAKVRWLRGHPEILLRLKGNWLEAFGRLNVPANLGTPGAANSQARANTGPAITDVSHRPVLPQAGQAVRVTARVSDPDGVTTVTLKYRIDTEAGPFSVPMVDDGTGADALAGDGIYTGLIPGQASGKLIAFAVEATDAFAPAATTQFPNDAPARECLVRVGETQPGGAFGTYRLWLTAATVNTWATREKLSNENLDGTFVHGANRVVYNIGGHYSGSPYTSPGYTSPVGALCGYDIIFPTDDPFLGETHTVMDWPIRDDTDQREQLMFWLLEQYGLPNMYRRYVIMFVNGVRRGTLYDDVQQPTSTTVNEWFPDDSNGTLMKPDCWDEFADSGDRETGCIDLNSLELYTTTGGVKKTARYRWTWKPRAVHGTANDYSDIFSLVDAANAPTNNFQAAMECLADMAHWMRTFAMNDLASFWDAFGNPNAKNTFLYKPEHDTWKLMCWDFDVGLGVFNDPVNDPLFPTLNDTQMNRVYATPAWTRLYWNALSEGVNSFFNSGPGTRVDAILDAKYAAFQASGLALNGPAGIKSWISQRRAFLLTQLNTVAASFTVTTPATTNRNLVTISGTAPVTVHALFINGVAYTPVWTSVTAWRVVLPVAAGANTLSVVGRDRFGNAVAGASSSVAVTFTGADESPVGAVIINEIMYNPAVPEASYLELFNRSTNNAFDLSGWRLNGLDFDFPPGTVISNRGFLVVCKNRVAFANAYGWGVPVLCEFSGRLDDGGETLSLVKPGVTPAQDLLVNLVTYDDDAPWPAAADGHGASLQLLDTDQDNNRVSNWGDGSGWKFHSYTAGVGGSSLTRLSFFFETAGGDVYLDDLSLVIGNTPGVGVNVLSNGDFESILSPPWQRGPLAANAVITTSAAYSGTASLHLVVTPGGQAVTTFYQDFPTLTSSTNYTLSYRYLPGSSGSNLTTRLNSLFRTTNDTRALHYTPSAPNMPQTTLPPYPPLWLGEVQPINTITLADNVGDFDPWIELHNAGTTNLPLDGFTLANSFSNLSQWAFPPGVVLLPGEFLVVWADAEPDETAGTNLHTSFRLEPTNGTVVLSRAGQILDYLSYTGVGTNRSFGAWPPDQASFRQVFNFSTPGRTNDPSALPVTLFINEWMAVNGGAISDPADFNFDDWFEIYNPATIPVDLAGFHLSDEPANPMKFTVPAGISVPAQGFLLVWADEQIGQTQPGGDLHVNFKLSQTGEAIALHDPNGRLIDSVIFGAQTNNISQGRWPDGAASLYFMFVPTPRGPNFIPPVLPPEIHILDSDHILDVTPGSAALTWTAEPGRIYRVQFKNELNDAMWTDLPGDVIAADPTATKTDSTLGANPHRFYRILFVQ